MGNVGTTSFRDGVVNDVNDAIEGERSDPGDVKFLEIILVVRGK